MICFSYTISLQPAPYPNQLVQKFGILLQLWPQMNVKIIELMSLQATIIILSLKDIWGPE